VLIVDEAQGLRTEVLEAIRMLLNLEAGGERLVQIVLAGQPEFDTKINTPELRQLRQRIALRCRLGPLTLDETFLYVEHRLRIAGGASESVFEPEAIAALHYYARGTPRVINGLCEQALMKACAERQRPVPPKTIEEVAFQSQVDGHKPVGAPVQLGDLMMMNAIAARSKRANARLAVSAPLNPEAAAAAPPEVETRPDPAGATESSPETTPMPVSAIKPEETPAPAPPAPVVSNAPTFASAPIDFHADPAPVPVQAAAPLAAPKELSPEPFLLPIGPISDRAAAKNAAPARVTEFAKPSSDSRSPLPRTPTPPSLPEPAGIAPRPSSATAPLPAKTQRSLAASLSSIERATSNWLRWLREPIGSNRGTKPGKAR
jgi:AAA domain-containing protein